MRVGSLFSGLGGFDLGLEWAGMRTVWFCEQDPYCQRVLARHWSSPVYPDVCELRGDDVGRVDLLCGGFPCQDISSAGLKTGIKGKRSGLWSEYARLIDELRPRYVLVENVAALIVRGLDVVLADLAALGMDAEWGCIRAADIGAPHLRDRFWLVGYPSGTGKSVGPINAEASRGSQLADSDAQRRNGGARVFGPGWWRELEDCGWWTAQPGVCGVADGLPEGLVVSGGPSRDRGKRNQALGNALVPQIAEWIGRRVMAYENERVAA